MLVSLLRSKPGHLRSFGDFYLREHDLTLPHAVRARESSEAVFDYYRSQLPTLRQDLEPLQSSLRELQDQQSGAARALLALERSVPSCCAVCQPPLVPRAPRLLLVKQCLHVK